MISEQAGCFYQFVLVQYRWFLPRKIKAFISTKGNWLIFPCCSGFHV
jgi:hypothetical protein